MKFLLFLLFLFIYVPTVAQKPSIPLQYDGPDVPLQQPIRNFAISPNSRTIVYITGNEAIFHDINENKAIAKRRVPADAKDFKVDFDALAISPTDKEDTGIVYSGNNSNSYGFDFIKVQDEDKQALMDQLKKSHPTLQLNNEYDLYAHQKKAKVDGWFEWHADLYFYQVPGEFDEDLQKYITDSMVYEFNTDLKLQSTKKPEVIRVLIENMEEKVRSTSINRGRFAPRLESFKYRRDHIFVYPVDSYWYEGNNGSSGNYAYTTYLPAQGLNELHYINLRTLEGFDIKNAPSNVFMNDLIDAYGLTYLIKKDTVHLAERLHPAYKTLIEKDEDGYEIKTTTAEIKLKSLRIKAQKTETPNSVQLDFSKKEKGTFYLFPENLNYYIEKEGDFPEQLIKIWKEGNGTFVPYDYDLEVNPPHMMSDTLYPYFESNNYSKSGMKNITLLNDLFKDNRKKEMGKVDYVIGDGESRDQVNARWDAYDLEVRFLRHKKNKSIVEINHKNQSVFNISIPLLDTSQSDYKSVLATFNEWNNDGENDMYGLMINALCPDTCYNDKTPPLSPALISGISSNKRFLFLESYQLNNNTYYISIIDLEKKASIYTYAISKIEYYRMPSFDADFKQLTLPVSPVKSIVLDLERLDENGVALELNAIYHDK